MRAIQGVFAAEQVESHKGIVILYVFISVRRVDAHFATFNWEKGCVVKLRQSLHLLMEDLILKLKFKEHLGLLFEQLIGQATSMDRQELIVVLLGKVNEH